MKIVTPYRSFALLAIACFATAANATEISVPGDHATIAAAIGAANTGDVIRVAAGDHAGALVNKSVTIKGEEGARITSGPVHSSGLIQGFRLLAGSEGTTISHLTFTTDLSIMNGDGVNTVTVTQCTFLNALQAISNWRGGGWEITHNKIVNLKTRNGGGIGVLLGDFSGGSNVQDNVVSHNTFEGTLTTGAGELGGYNGSAIVLYADFRWGRTGTSAMAYNRIVKNKVAMVAANPSLVDIVAFEVTDTRDNPAYDVINNNQVMFNDWRGTTQQYFFTPSVLEDSNAYSRNFGENRGHGRRPGACAPN